MRLLSSKLQNQIFIDKNTKIKTLVVTAMLLISYIAKQQTRLASTMQQLAYSQNSLHQNHPVAVLLHACTQHVCRLAMYMIDAHPRCYIASV